MNPQMFDQMRKNMSHSDAKTAAARMATMSDQELRNYAQMSGMPGMTPEMMRMSAQMMSGMDSSQFDQYKNMAGSMGGFPGAAGGQAGNTSNTSSSGPSLNRSNTTPSQNTQNSSSNFPKIEGLKSKGNNFFKAGDMDQAGSSYFEAILEIEELRIKSPKLESSELTTLEVSCRLNYATVKSKQEEWDISLEQAQKALKHGENGKAIFRVGQAQYHLGNKKEAVHNLRKATKLLTSDTTVKELLEKCETELRNEGSTSTTTTQEKVSSTKREEEVKPKPSEEPQESTTQSSGQSKLKKKSVGESFEPEYDTSKPKASTTSSSSNYNSSDNEIKRTHSEPAKNAKTSDVVIEEEERKEPPKQPTQQFNSAGSANAHNFDQERIKQAREGLSNMSPDQMKMATDFMKNADPSFIKQMMRQQTGMDMSDDQINMMKSMMTPEMLQFAANNPDLAASMGGGRAGASAGANVGGGSTGGDVTAQTNAGMPPGFPAGFPGFGGGDKPDISTLMNNPEMINNLMKTMGKNPEMLKGMSKMLGENNPLAKMLDNRSPEEIEKMMNSMQKVFGAFQKVSPAISFVRKYWKHMVVLFVAFLVYRYVL